MVELSKKKLLITGYVNVKREKPLVVIVLCMYIASQRAEIMCPTTHT